MRPCEPDRSYWPIFPTKPSVGVQLGAVLAASILPFYNDGGHLPSIPVIGAVVAQRTKNLRIGSGIALPPLQDPVRLAERVCHARLPLQTGDWSSESGVAFSEANIMPLNAIWAIAGSLFEESHDIILNAVVASNDKPAYSDQYSPYTKLKDAFQTLTTMGICTRNELYSATLTSASNVCTRLRLWASLM